MHIVLSLLVTEMANFSLEMANFSLEEDDDYDG